MIRLTYAPDLVEESVLLAERFMPIAERRAFRRERDRVYELSDPDERERRFQAIHVRWFGQLGLNRALEASVHQCGRLADRVADGRVLCALTRRDEGADLMDRLEPETAVLRPLLVIRLRPATLLEADTVRALLGHELMHVGDMLDPLFGYERSLPTSDAGPSADNIVRDRYRVLWDVTIDGRLAREGRGDDNVRAARWREFRSTFPMLGEACRAAFDEWFDCARPTHHALAAFAVAPNGVNTPTSGESGRCPVCRFPGRLDRDLQRLSAAAHEAIRADHPAWRCEDGLCTQCLDLYEARVAAEPRQMVGRTT